MDETTLRTLAGARPMEPKERKNRTFQLRKLHVELYGKKPVLPYRSKIEAFIRKMKELDYDETAAWDYLDWVTRKWPTFSKRESFKGLSAFEDRTPSYSLAVSTFGLERLLPVWEKVKNEPDLKAKAQELMKIARRR